MGALCIGVGAGIDDSVSFSRSGLHDSIQLPDKSTAALILSIARRMPLVNDQSVMYPSPVLARLHTRSIWDTSSSKQGCHGSSPRSCPRPASPIMNANQDPEGVATLDRRRGNSRERLGCGREWNQEVQGRRGFTRSATDDRRDRTQAQNESNQRCDFIPRAARSLAEVSPSVLGVLFTW